MADTSFDLIVVGGGPGGYVAAIRAAQLGMKTAVVEREHLGGICLNWGCIPTKALLRTSEVGHHPAACSTPSAFSAKDVSFDLKKIVERSRKVAEQLSDGVGFLMKKNKVTVFDGDGQARRHAASCKVEQGRQAGRRPHGQAHHPGDRRAGALAAGARARRQAGLDLQGSDGAGGDAEVAAGGRLGRHRHRVRQLLPRPRRRGDGGRSARPRPAGRGRGDLGLRPQGLREAGHEDHDRRHGEGAEEGRRQRHGHDRRRRQDVRRSPSTASSSPSASSAMSRTSASKAPR